MIRFFSQSKTHRLRWVNEKIEFKERRKRPNLEFNEVK